VVVEKERQRVVDTYRREMAAFRIGMEAKNARKKLRRCPLVVAQTYRSRRNIDRSYRL